jgi:hypothetical protein
MENTEEDMERRGNVTVIEDVVNVLPWSLHFAAGAPKYDAEGKNRPLRSLRLRSGQAG